MEINSKDKIFIIDDIQQNIELVKSMLGDHYSYISANSGEEAIDIATKASDISLILLDLKMPGMSGHDVCKIFMANEKTKKIPIIFITGSIEADIESKSLELGAVDFITKPFNIDTLNRRVETHLNLFKYKNKLEEMLLLKNNNIKEYAFMTSHNIRKPLANILGWIEVYNHQKLDDPVNLKVMANIKKESEELDELIKKAAQLLHKVDNSHE